MYASPDLSVLNYNINFIHNKFTEGASTHDICLSYDSRECNDNLNCTHVRGDLATGVYMHGVLILN